MAGGELIRVRGGQALRIVSSTTERLEMESTWEPESGIPPRHYHPQQDERFEVLEGSLTVRVGREPPRVLGPGETLEVPRGTPHQMWNGGAVPARARWDVRPALRTEEMFRSMDGGMSPPQAAKLLWSYRREFRLAGPLKR